MITGVHTMFYASEVEQLRRFIRDRLGFRATDVGYGHAVHFEMPGGVKIELNQPSCK